MSRNVTSLVGANQSGKTNILRAIEMFSSGEYKPDDVCDYSVAAKASEIDGELPMVTVILRAADNAKDFGAISPRLPKIDEVRVTRKYNGEYVIVIPNVDQEGSGVAQTKQMMRAVSDELRGLLAHSRDLLEGFDNEVMQVDDMLDDFMTSLGTHVEGRKVTIYPRASDFYQEIKGTLEVLMVAMVTATQEAEVKGGEAQIVKARRAKTGKNIRELMGKLDSLVADYEDRTLSSGAITSAIESAMPKFVYVSAEHGRLLQGEVDLNEVKRAPDDAVQFVSVRRLLKLANIELNEITKEMSAVRRRQRLADAADRVTNILEKVWKQQKIKVSLELSGAESTLLRIYLSSDGGPERYPEQQSYGFRWYLEFYLGYALAIGDGDGKQVLLLDEPGIHLHPLAQRNLVGVLREIGNQNQVIHTTHHTDMLDLESPENWRVVENAERGRAGTFVIGDAHLSGEDHVGFEVVTRALWGAGIVPNLLIGPKNLIVEGLADIFLLGIASKLLGGEDVENAMLINGEITMIHTGGLSHYRKILTFCSRPELNTVAFFDSDETGRKKKSELIKDGIISADKTVEINDAYASDTSEERDIEHIFGFSLLKEAAMKVYGNSLATGFDFKRDELPTKGALGRRLKDFFESKGVDKYDKAKVALALKNILQENNSKLTDSSRERLRVLFSRIRESFGQ